MYEVSCIYGISLELNVCVNKSWTKKMRSIYRGCFSCLRSLSIGRATINESSTKSIIPLIVWLLIQHRNESLSDANPYFQKSGSQIHFCLKMSEDIIWSYKPCKLKSSLKKSKKVFLYSLCKFSAPNAFFCHPFNSFGTIWNTITLILKYISTRSYCVMP
jgi:hypothetical protein